MKAILTIIITLLIAFLSYNVISLSFEKQQMKYELAELNNIKYGLFNIDVWKEKVAEIIVKKIDEFEITHENREVIKGHIERALYKLLDELADFLERNQREGNWFEKITKTVVYGIAFDRDKFRQEVPRFANEIISVIETPQTKEQFRDYVKDRLAKLIDETRSGQDLSVLNAIQKKHHCETCTSFLEGKVARLSSKIIWYAVPLLLLSIVIFVAGLLNENIAVLFRFGSMFILAALIIVGTSVPMISIDVRIMKFSFALMGENISFRNQVLYYQSKSILQVIKILFSDGRFYSMLTGFLIFVFSIAFPFSKIVSLLYEEVTKRSTPLTTFLINKTGKWSMADVMVVAIFLSYMGINSFLDSFLKLAHNASDKVEIIPNSNYSSLELGVLFFAVFVLMTLLMKSKNTHDNYKILNSTL